MAFDQCPPGQAERAVAAEAARRTLDWLARCRTSFEELKRSDPEGPEQTLFPIVQGGVYPELRAAHAAELVALDLDGYAIGGLSVGESKAEMFAIAHQTATSRKTPNVHSKAVRTSEPV